MKRKYLFILLFVLLSILVALFLKQLESNSIEEHLNNKTEQFNHVYKSIYHEYQNLSYVIYETQINKKDVVDIFKQTLNANTKERDSVREKLYNHLKEKYSHLKKYGVRQLHFHLPNNISFLRFHKKEMYGDNLSKRRLTVAYVNRHKTYIHGYEIGGVTGGFRFIYPLFNESEVYIGSVEISIRTLSFIREIINHFNFPSMFVAKKLTVDEKVLESEKSNFLLLDCGDYYFEKDTYSDIKQRFDIEKYKMLPKESITLFHRGIDEGKTFSIFDKKLSNIITFLPVRNPITEKVVGAIAARSDGSYIVKQIEEFYWLTAISVIMIFFILYARYRELFFKDTLILNNKKLQTIIEEADSGISIMNLNGNFLDVNQVYCDLLGYTKEEFLSLNCIQLTKDICQKKALDTLNKAMQETRVSKIRKICIRKDGSEVNLELSLTLLPSKDMFVAVINSLEEQIQLEKLSDDLLKKIKNEMEKNRETKKTMLHQSRYVQMGEMISMIAHQWRQPLSAISMVSLNLSTKITLNKYDKELFKKKLEKISEYSQYLSETIDDFRNFYDPEKKKHLIVAEDIFEGALNIVEVSIKNKNIEIKKEYKCKDSIQTYLNELKQVVLNLIKNAEEALLEKEIKNPTIILTTDKDQEFMYLRVRDNAGGVPEEIMKSIFESSFTTKGKKDGTGLGLYMSKIIIEDHCNGFLEVENSNVGADFTIKLPLNSDNKE